ncbi:MAG: hypothetical protein JEZ08_08580 [Clostridiales bacterium]|nr:hypothetical protein [Clostridiales bacterium]
MDETHWYTIYLDGNLESTTIIKMIDDSYNIINKLWNKSVKVELKSRAESSAILV